MRSVDRQACYDRYITGEIVEKAKSQTTRMIRYWRLTHKLHDDLYSAAMLSLVRSAVKYKPLYDRDDFQAYALAHCYWDIVDELRGLIGDARRCQQIRNILNPLSVDFSYVDDTDDNDTKDYANVLGVHDPEFDRIADIDLIISLCQNERDFIICMLYLDGYTMKEIGEVYGVSEGRISQLFGIMGTRKAA